MLAPCILPFLPHKSTFRLDKFEKFENKYDSKFDTKYDTYDEDEPKSKYSGKLKKLGL
jgi:hypothetical protein